MTAESTPVQYPVGIQDFAKLRREGYKYIDKTGYIYKLSKTSGYIFLARPRRFGKSLLLSTIQCFYEGKRELFEGLEIERLVDEWVEYPVLRLDLNSRNYNHPDSLTEEVIKHLEKWESIYGNEKRDRAIEERFGYIIERAHSITGKPVVVLVDEYDKPLVASLDDPELFEIFRNQLRAIYGNLKSYDGIIRFTMMTGVARFTKLSVFSDTNQFRDISFEDGYAGICGITSEELDANFKEGIQKLSEKFGMTVTEMREELSRLYDGYHFASSSPDIYNPFSLMNVFASMKLGNYWAQTGTPTFMVKKIAESYRRPFDLNEVYVTGRELEAAGITGKDPIPHLYQAGYLTIKDSDLKYDELTLGLPNAEVKEAFYSVLLPIYMGDEGGETSSCFDIQSFRREIFRGDYKAFMTRLESLTASIPYTSAKAPAESRFQDVVYLVFALLGFFTQTEIRTSVGRTDVVVHSPDYIYIFEFKVDRLPEVALDQIREKGYWKPYVASGKKIILIGVSFDSTTRTISGWIPEELKII